MYIKLYFSTDGICIWNDNDINANENFSRETRFHIISCTFGDFHNTPKFSSLYLRLRRLSVSRLWRPAN